VKLVEINWDPTDRQLRQFGAISVVAFPGIAWLWGGSQAWIVPLAATGVAMAVCGWFRPRLLRPFFLGITIAAIPIGLVVGELAMLTISQFFCRSDWRSAVPVATACN
jgi:hypothetical protein